MIIIDLSQIAISSLMVQLSHTNGTMEVNEGMIRHLILNNIRHIKNRFGNRYGELIIACDARHSWRKTIFPFYKANRKKTRDESGLDWSHIFSIFDKIKTELKEYFSYRVIEVELAEADDIIGTLCQTYSAEEPIMIISGDKDFIQLQRFANVKQYDPIRDKSLTTEDWRLYLKEHIIRGDSGDGVPNFLSDDDTFVSGKRQNAIRKTKLETWLTQEPSEFCDTETMLNYKRNSVLIDLSYTPSDLKADIIKQYVNEANKSGDNIYNYFVNNKLVNLLTYVGDF